MHEALPADPAVPRAQLDLSPLNEAQRSAVVFGAPGKGEDRALLVIAGAGSGKTNTLAYRVAHLISGGADPRRILLLTFSVRAAQEMTRRVRRICAQLRAHAGRGVDAGLNWSGTFHSIGARLLRDFAPRIGIDPAFGIHDREDSADLMNIVRHELGASTKERRFPLKATCLAIYSSAVNTRRDLHEVLARDFPWCAEWEAELKTLFQSYVQAKQAQRVLDFDDLLLYWAHLAGEAAMARELGDRFDHVLVDEYQDTNSLQALILLSMKPDGRGLTVVGDDAQSIYSFRGAQVRNILEFDRQFDPPAQRIALERNYRSCRPILEAANAVIGLAAQGHRKALWTDRAQGARPRLVAVRDEAGQAAFVVQEVLARRERALPLKSQAVLFRAAQHSAQLELELARSRIPFVKFGGLKFLEARHVKDVFSILRWAINPADHVCGFRAAQLLPGVGPRTAERIVRAGANELPAGAAAPLREAWPGFAGLLEQLRRKDCAWPLPIELACRWVQAEADRLYEDAPARRADLQQLAHIAATYASLERFLTEVTLDPPDASSAEAGVPHLDEDYLILSTIHSAKGREWNAVTLLNAVDGCLPSDLATGSSDQIEEERRLLYVAMTRARDELDILVPQRFHVTQQPGAGDRHVYALRSRFLPDCVLDRFERVSWPTADPEDALAQAKGATVVDLASRARAMWA
jgi:DNA helicase II / ATP-dependent DNA helicase PcrA